MTNILHYTTISFWFLFLLCRFIRGVKTRSIWYLIHWLMGISICMVGIANIYIGLHTYHKKTSKSVRLWVVLFTLEVSLIGFAYLLQDRWQYILGQGAWHCDEQIRPTDNMNSPSTSVDKEHVAIPRIRDFLDWSLLFWFFFVFLFFFLYFHPISFSKYLVLVVRCVFAVLFSAKTSVA